MSRGDGVILLQHCTALSCLSSRRWRDRCGVRCGVRLLHCTALLLLALRGLTLFHRDFSERVPAIFLEACDPLYASTTDHRAVCSLGSAVLAASKTLATPQSHQPAPFVLATVLRARRRVGSRFEASSRLLDLRAHTRTACHLIAAELGFDNCIAFLYITDVPGEGRK